MTYYHASSIEGISELQPSLSGHDIPLVYFSRKRENVLVYLSNAIERFCIESGFSYEGKCATWGPYGFTKDGILQIQEYYPNALEETYAGAHGFIYTAEDISEYGLDIKIPFAAVSALPVPVTGCEVVEDALTAILDAEIKGLIKIGRYEELSKSAKFREWNRRTIREQYEGAADHPEYRWFIEHKFADIL